MPSGPATCSTSRAGKTVEIGNTDAEGRLVLADALALADEDKPDTLLSFATLTGAARVALGPELPPFFTDDDAFAQAVLRRRHARRRSGLAHAVLAGYEANLDSAVADMNNVADGPFAGAVTAALFLRRFVKQARRFAHFDIYGWRPAPKPLGPKGGEVQAARALLEVLRAEPNTSRKPNRPGRDQRSARQAPPRLPRRSRRRQPARHASPALHYVAGSARPGDPFGYPAACPAGHQRRLDHGGPVRRDGHGLRQQGRLGLGAARARRLRRLCARMSR